MFYLFSIIPCKCKRTASTEVVETIYNSHEFYPNFDIFFTRSTPITQHRKTSLKSNCSPSLGNNLFLQFVGLLLIVAIYKCADVRLQENVHTYCKTDTSYIYLFRFILRARNLQIFTCTLSYSAFLISINKKPSLYAQGSLLFKPYYRSLWKD